MSKSVRSRPAVLRALGKGEPPEEVVVQGRLCRRVEIFKHDSWAATARYRGDGLDIVCKFNRVQPIILFPMRWLGRLLAKRETAALKRLAGIPGIPAELGPVCVNMQRFRNAVAHEFVAGRPLKRWQGQSEQFFKDLFCLLKQVHRRKMAYVDLHKRENILVGDDGKPYLFDFQVGFGLTPERVEQRGLRARLLRALQGADWYHFAKHVKHHCPEAVEHLGVVQLEKRPWWLELHRKVAKPLRQFRRSLLIAIGIRGKCGRAESEAFAEIAKRELPAKRAA